MHSPANLSLDFGNICTLVEYHSEENLSTSGMRSECRNVGKTTPKMFETKFVLYKFSKKKFRNLEDHER